MDIFIYIAPDKGSHSTKEISAQVSNIRKVIFLGTRFEKL